MKRALLRSLGIVGLLPIAYVILAVIGAVLPGGRANLEPGEDFVIGLVSGPIHYDFVLPLDSQTRGHFDFAASAGVPVRSPDAHWLVVGWGAKDFYTTVGTYRDVTLRAVVKGITGDRSVMRVEAIGQIRDWSEVQTIRLSTAQYSALIEEILSGFSAEDPFVSASTPGQSGAFFAGHETFHIGRTCNQWLGRTLRQAGVQLGAWTPIPASMRLSLWRFGYS